MNDVALTDEQTQATAELLRDGAYFLAVMQEINEVLITKYNACIFHTGQRTTFVQDVRGQQEPQTAYLTPSEAVKAALVLIGGASER